MKLPIEYEVINEKEDGKENRAARQLSEWFSTCMSGGPGMMAVVYLETDTGPMHLYPVNTNLETTALMLAGAVEMIASAMEESAKEVRH